MTAVERDSQHLFQRNLQPLSGFCDAIFPDPDPDSSPTTSPSSAPSDAPRECRTVVGRGICQDSAGELFNACFKYGGLRRQNECRAAAEASGKAVGWQYGVVGTVPGVCVLFFDEADVDSRVTDLCPSNFNRFGLSGRLGTGYPTRTGTGVPECHSCE